MFQAAVDRGTATADTFDAIGSLYAQSGTGAKRGPGSNTPSPSIVPTFRPASISASLQRQQHDLDAALVSLQAAVTLDPANALAQSEYGRTLEPQAKTKKRLPIRRGHQTQTPISPVFKTNLPWHSNVKASTGSDSMVPGSHQA